MCSHVFSARARLWERAGAKRCGTTEIGDDGRRRRARCGMDFGQRWEAGGRRQSWRRWRGAMKVWGVRGGEITGAENTESASSEGTYSVAVLQQMIVRSRRAITQSGWGTEEIITWEYVKKAKVDRGEAAPGGCLIPGYVREKVRARWNNDEMEGKILEERKRREPTRWDEM